MVWSGTWLKTRPVTRNSSWSPWKLCGKSWMKPPVVLLFHSNLYSDSWGDHLLFSFLASLAFDNNFRLRWPLRRKHILRCLFGVGTRDNVKRNATAFTRSSCHWKLWTQRCIWLKNATDTCVQASMSARLGKVGRVLRVVQSLSSH